MASFRISSLKALNQKLFSPSFSSSLIRQNPNEKTLIENLQRQKWIATTSGGDNKKEIAVSENSGKKKFKLFPWRNSKKGIWKKNNSHLMHPLNGLGNAVLQATQNMNKLFENLNISPWTLSGRVKEQDDCYKLRYDMPGISKEELKITVEDGVLRIVGEHKEENEEDSDDEYWSAKSYGFYNASILLPDDAKTDEIKAELKDGVLNLTIPRTEVQKKDVKEIEIH